MTHHYHAPPQPPLAVLVRRYEQICRLNRAERCFERFMRPVEVRKRHARRHWR